MLRIKSLVIGYWNAELSPAIWIRCVLSSLKRGVLTQVPHRSIILVVICSINFFGVKWYGEAEVKGCHTHQTAFPV